MANIDWKPGDMAGNFERVNRQTRRRRAVKRLVSGWYIGPALLLSIAIWIVLAVTTWRSVFCAGCEL